VKRINVGSALEMLAAVDAELDLAASSIRIDCFIAVAAVADWRVANPSEQKIKKPGAAADKGGAPKLELVENPDILASVARRPRAPFCVGFAAESERLLEHAQQKRQRKGVPLIVGNIGPDTFGRDDNDLVLVEEAGITPLGRGRKDDLATRLVAEIARRLPAADR
jgi:phosphopantothenoylcysteine decarboxylase/phosphopantothenate--cysteine ligase